MDEEKSPSELLASRAADAAEGGKKELDAVHGTFEANLKAIEERAADAKQKFNSTRSQAVGGEKSSGQSGEEARDLGMGLSIAYAILGIPLVFFFVGLAIDKGRPGAFWQSSLGLLGTVIGLGYAFLMVTRRKK